MLGSAPPSWKDRDQQAEADRFQLISDGDRPVRARVQHSHEYARSECAEDGFESKTRAPSAMPAASKTVKRMRICALISANRSANAVKGPICSAPRTAAAIAPSRPSSSSRPASGMDDPPTPSESATTAVT